MTNKQKDLEIEFDLLISQMRAKMFAIAHLEEEMQMLQNRKDMLLVKMVQT